MSLSRCTDCGGSVSTLANACPHCGAPPPTARGADEAAPVRSSNPSEMSREVGADSSPAAVKGPVLPPAGWYDDASKLRQLRYWDGQKWTDQVRRPVDEQSPTPDADMPSPANSGSSQVRPTRETPSNDAANWLAKAANGATLQRAKVWSQAHPVEALVYAALTAIALLLLIIIVVNQVSSGSDQESFRDGAAWGRTMVDTAESFGTTGTADFSSACRSQADIVERFGDAVFAPGEVDKDAFVRGCLQAVSPGD